MVSQPIYAVCSFSDNVSHRRPQVQGFFSAQTRPRGSTPRHPGKGELEPPDALLDLATGIVESNVVCEPVLSVVPSGRMSCCCSTRNTGWGRRWHRRSQWAFQQRCLPLIKADQQLWLLASDEGLPSLNPAADGVKPLWRSFEFICVSPHTLFLCPFMWPKRAQLLSQGPRRQAR